MKNGEKTVEITPIFYFIICKSSDATTLPISVLICRVKFDFMQKKLAKMCPSYRNIFITKSINFGGYSRCFDFSSITVNPTLPRVSVNLFRLGKEMLGLVPPHSVWRETGS